MVTILSTGILSTGMFKQPREEWLLRNQTLPFRRACLTSLLKVGFEMQAAAPGRIDVDGLGVVCRDIG